MPESTQVLVVEDDLVVRTTLDALLSDMGHQVCGFADNALDALVLFSTKMPDILIVDINLNGNVDGIELARKCNEIRKVPILFLTAHDDESIFEKAKSASPFAFISKPLNRQVLQRAISLALENSYAGATESAITDASEQVLYTRIGHRLRKIPIRDIESVEVEGKYCTLNLGGKAITCKITMKDLLALLPQKNFVQVTRNHAVNLDKIEDVDMAHMTVKMPHSEIPISRGFKEQLFNRIRVI